MNVKTKAKSRRLTAGNVNEFAANIAPEDRLDDAEATLEVLRAVFRETSNYVKKQVLSDMVKRAEHFQNADAPGHSTWYPHHLQIAAKAATMIGP